MKEWQKGRGEREWVWVQLTDFWSVPSPPPHRPASPPHHTWKMFEGWEVWMDDCIVQRTAIYDNQLDTGTPTQVRWGMENGGMRGLGSVAGLSPSWADEERNGGRVGKECEESTRKVRGKYEESTRQVRGE